MGSFFCCLFFWLWSQAVLSQSEWKDHYPPEDFKVFEPSRFFEEFESDYFPEMKGLDPSRWEEMGRLMNFLQNHGIPIGIGTNANNHSIFELYLPLISRPDGMIGPQIGVTRESRVGNLYFLAHDAVHHYVGIPGPRMKDLQTREESLQKLIRIMLLKEQVATVHSMSVYMKRFWNWRDEFRHGVTREDFVRLNQGLLSMGPVSRDQYVKTIGDFVFGRSASYGKDLWKHIDPQTVREARRAGVPLGAASFYPWTGIALESWILKFLIPFVEPILARYREVGFEGFMAYSTAMAEFMLQPWYVEWAERFEFGIPLDELEARSERHLEDLRQGKLLGDASAVDTNEFQRQALLNEIALLGRRVAEAKEMARRGAIVESFSPSSLQDLSNYFEGLVSLHQMLKAESQATELVVYIYREALKDQMAALEKSYRMEQILRPEYQQPYLNYDRYWRELTGILVPRSGHNSSALSVKDTKEFIQKRRQSAESLWGRARWAVNKEVQKTQFGAPEYFNLKVALADDYEKAQNEVRPMRKDADSETSSEPAFLRKLNEVVLAVDYQLDSVVVPQIIESFKFTADQKADAFKIFRDYRWKVYHGAQALREAYDAVYLNTRPVRSMSDELYLRESRLNFFLQESHAILFRFVQKLQAGTGGDRLLQILHELHVLNEKFSDVTRFISESPTAAIQTIFPNKSHRWWMVGDLLGRLFGNSKSTLFADLKSASLPMRILRETKLPSFRIEGLEPLRADLTSDAVFILNLNHDQALLEVALAHEFFKQLKVDKTFVLTTRKAWGLVPKAKRPDAETVYIEDEKPLDLLAQKVASSKGKRIGILLCPEGQRPATNVSMPLTAKPGAFVFARKLAVLLKDKMPVVSLTGIFNGMDHFTSAEAIPLVLKVLGMERVPNHPLAPNDPWVADARLRFENLANTMRAHRFVDLIHPRKASGTNLAVTGPVKRYLPMGEWFRGSTFPKCAAIVRQLHGLPYL